MFKHLVSELKEALVCLQAGQVTLGYPFQPHSPEANFRGKVVVDASLCTGCGACAMACPARLISFQDDGEYRAIDFALARCTYCAQCRDVCPTRAITLSPQFETATPQIQDLGIRLELSLVRCRKCGQVVGTQRALKRIKNELTEQIGMAPETMDWLELCIACKRQEALTTPALMLEVVG